VANGSKEIFCKTAYHASAIASEYLNGSPIRQNHFKTAIRWIASKDGKEIEDFMAEHQHDTNCNDLWLYF
jgi:hypothetical protein